MGLSLPRPTEPTSSAAGRVSSWKKLLPARAGCIHDILPEIAFFLAPLASVLPPNPGWGKGGPKAGGKE